MDLKDHLVRLSQAHGASGHEAAVREIVLADWLPLCDEVTTDALGNAIGAKWGCTSNSSPHRRIMLAAHMDEIGMMVRDVVDGFVRLANMGGIDGRVMLAQPVMVHGTEPLPGVVATLPPHLLPADKRSKYQPVEELMVDLGLPAEEVAAKVRVGDLVTVDVPALSLMGDRIAGKAMDNRACVAAVSWCLHELQSRQHVWDVFAVATVQEEVGIRGAKVAAHNVNPDVAIALDVTFGIQPGVGESDGGHKLGSGPAVSLGPNFHPKLFDKLMEAAQRLEMNVNMDPIPGRSGTDAWSIQVARSGIPTALINVPIRNMHSPVEIVDLADVKRAGRLLAEFIVGLEEDFLATIAWDDPLAADTDAKEEA